MVVGDVDEPAATAAVANVFGAVEGAGEAPGPTPRPRAAGRAPRGSSSSTAPAPSSRRSSRAGPAPTVDRSRLLPVLVANTICAGAFGSRLVENIREDKGYTYSPGGDIHDAPRRGASSTVQADVRNEVTAATLLEIFYELDRMGATTPTRRRARRGEALPGRASTSSATRSRARSPRPSPRNWVNGLPPEALGEFVPKVNAVTAEGVQAAGRKHFLSSTQTVVVVGDAKEARPQLELFGTVKDMKP